MTSRPISSLRGAICPACGWEGDAAVGAVLQGYLILGCPKCYLQFADPMRGADTEFYDLDYEQRPPSLADTVRVRYTARYRLAFRLLGKGNGRRLLDVGCGMGGFAAEAYARGFESFGIEQSQSAIRHCTTHLGLPTSRFYHGSWETIPHDWGGFDVVTAFEVLEHLATPHDFVARCFGLLKVGGVLVLSVPDASRIQVRLGQRNPGDYPPKHLTRWTPTAVAELLSRVGFETATISRSPLEATPLASAAYRILAGRFRGGLPETQAPRTTAANGSPHSTENAQPRRGWRLLRILARSGLSKSLGGGLHWVANLLFWQGRTITAKIGLYGDSLVCVARRPHDGQ